MNAQTAQKITAESKDTLSSFSDALIYQAKVHIYEKIERSARLGHSETKIDLRAVGFEIINKNLDRVKIELEKDGYKVDYRLTRTPDGVREMVVTW